MVVVLLLDTRTVCLAIHERDVEKRILEAAKILFAEKGHEETKLREIAAGAQTSESQVIKYFHSKTGLLDALIKKAIKHMDDSIQELRKQNDDPLVVIRKIPTVPFNLLKNDRELLIVYLFSRQFYTLVPEEQNLLESNLIKELSAILKRGQDKGLFRNDFNPNAASCALWGALIHLMKSSFYTKKAKTYPSYSQKEMTNITNMFISSLTKKTST